MTEDEEDYVGPQPSTETDRLYAEAYKAGYIKGQLNPIAEGSSFTHQDREEIREAVANYIASEGCPCCEDRVAHDKAKSVLAKLLGVPKYEDSDGFDFYSFKSKDL